MSIGFDVTLLRTWQDVGAVRSQGAAPAAGAHASFQRDNMKFKSATRSLAVGAVSTRVRRGATTVEYALMLALLVVVAIVLISALGQNVKALFSKTADAVDYASSADGSGSSAVTGDDDSEDGDNSSDNNGGNSGNGSPGGNGNANSNAGNSNGNSGGGNSNNSNTSNGNGNAGSGNGHGNGNGGKK